MTKAIEQSGVIKVPVIEVLNGSRTMLVLGT